jgi:hypothetical protein
LVAVVEVVQELKLQVAVAQEVFLLVGLLYQELAP